MAGDQYRAGIVGLGFIGAGDPVSGEALGQQVRHLDGTHAEALARNPRIALVAGSSRDDGRRTRFEQRTGVRTYADWRAMLSRERLDIVSVATYSPTHAEITEACAKHGARVVYCEKPIAGSLPEAERMVSACAEAGTLLVVNHNRRFQPNCRRLRDLLASGGIGDLISGSLQWGSGRLGNVGTHIFDALRLIAGREVRAVSGTLDPSTRPDCRGDQFNDPGGWGLLRLDGGLMVTVDAANYGRAPLQMAVNGTLGRALTNGADVALEFWDGRREQWPRIQDGMTSMDRAVSEIVAWLDSGTPFPYPGEEALRTLEVIVAFHVSHGRSAAWAELPLVGEDRRVRVATA